MIRKLNIVKNNELLLGIIIFGISVRLSQYLYNRSLWIDEALVVGFIDWSLLDFYLPQFNHLPRGFIMVANSIVVIFGESEYSLRLFPLLCGLISLPLFYRFAKEYIEKESIVLAFVLFAINDKLIFYASELRPYETDVAIALLLYIGGSYIQSKRVSMSQMIIYACIGIIAIFFSHTAIFVLIGIGLTLITISIVDKRYKQAICISAVCLVWGITAITNYMLFYHRLAIDQHLINYHSSFFMPLPTKSISDIKWFAKNFFKVFKDPLGFIFPGIAAFAFIIGLVKMFSEEKRKCFILLSPIIITMITSGFRKYAFGEHIILFIAPVVILFIAVGGVKITTTTYYNKSKIIGIIFILLMIAQPILSASYHLLKPRMVEEIKPVLKYLDAKKQENDILYIYYGAVPAFKYYSRKHNYKTVDYFGVSSRSDWNKYFYDLDKLKGNKRVWILFSHVRHGNDVDEEKLFIFYLDKIGKKLDSFKSVGASIYLYDLAI